MPSALYKPDKSMTVSVHLLTGPKLLKVLTGPKDCNLLLIARFSPSDTRR